MTGHAKDCRWTKTSEAECEFKETHHYCPHEEHSCDCYTKTETVSIPEPAISSIKQIVTGLSDFLEKKVVDYIDEMVSSMQVQADIMSRARKEGIDISKMMDRIKTAYNTKNE